MSAGAERESKGNTFSHEFDANPKVRNCVKYSHHDCRIRRLLCLPKMPGPYVE